MDSVSHSAITPRKSKLAHTFAKVLHLRVQKTKSHEDMRKDDGQINKAIVEEAFLAKLFSNISALKAAYAQLQFSQSPYDADGIRSADQIIVSELKKLSELKQCYKKKTFDDPSPNMTLLSSEINEQNSLLTTYRITSMNLDSQLKLKDSEIIFLKEKLAEANSDNGLLEKRLNLAMLENTNISGLMPSYFIAYYREAILSTRRFVRLLISEMEFAEWDLEVAASSIQPGVSFVKSNDICFAFESFVCGEMFDGFNYPDFSIKTQQKQNRRVFFDAFLKVKSAKPTDYIAWKPKSIFAIFCRTKYLRLIHPRMELSVFGNLDQRNLVSGGEFPETDFFTTFCEMAKNVWMLHCLALSFDPEILIFQVSKNCRFSEVYMESLNEEAFVSSDPNVRVGFTVFPGFRIGKTIVQCQVYLRGSCTRVNCNLITSRGLNWVVNQVGSIEN